MEGPRRERLPRVDASVLKDLEAIGHGDAHQIRPKRTRQRGIGGLTRSTWRFWAKCRLCWGGWVVAGGDWETEGFGGQCNLEDSAVSASVGPFFVYYMHPWPFLCMSDMHPWPFIFFV